MLPEAFEFADDVEEFVEIDRFHEVALDGEEFHVGFVGLVGRAGEDDDGDVAQESVATDFGEDFAAVFFRQPEVQENQIGARARA